MARTTGAVEHLCESMKYLCLRIMSHPKRRDRRRSHVGRAGADPSAILDRRRARPALERFVECVHVGKAESVRNLAHREIRATQVTLGELETQVVEDLAVRRPFLFEATPERRDAHVELLRD